MIDEKQIRLLQSELDSLEIGDWATNDKNGKAEKIFFAPTIAEILDAPDNQEIRGKINQMLAGSSARKLYAAILLDAAAQQTKAEAVLGALKTDDSIVKITKSVGHGTLEIPVKRLAEAYLSEGTLRAGYLKKAEQLSNWMVGIWHEAVVQKKESGDFLVPTLDEVWAAKEDFDEQQILRQRLTEFAAHSAAKKLYASALLEEFDPAAAQNFLKSLATDTTPISVLFGDVVQPVPAHEVALALLEKREIRPRESRTDGVEGLTDRFFGWLNKQIFKDRG